MWHPAADAGDWTFTHTSSGRVTAPVDSPPTEAGCPGSYHVMTDGSARWIAVGDLARFAVSSDGVDQGYWWDSPEYRER